MNAIAFNTKILRNKLDEARDIKNGAIGLKEELYDLIFAEVREKIERTETASDVQTDNALKNVVEEYDPENIEDTISDEFDDLDDELSGTDKSYQEEEAEVNADNGGDSDE